MSNLFSGKNKKNIINLSSAELVQRVVKVKENGYSFRGAKCFAALLKRAVLLFGANSLLLDKTLFQKWIHVQEVIVVCKISILKINFITQVYG